MVHMVTWSLTGGNAYEIQAKECDTFEEAKKCKQELTSQMFRDKPRNTDIKIWHAILVE